MQALVILFENNNVLITDNVVSDMITSMLRNSSVNSDSVKITQLDSHGVLKCLLGSTHEILTEEIQPSVTIERNSPSYMEIEAAITFLKTLFGEVDGNENWFRARLNKAWYNREVLSVSDYERLRKVIKLISWFQTENKKLTRLEDAIRKKLFVENGLGFLPNYAFALIRFEDM